MTQQDPQGGVSLAKGDGPAVADAPAGPACATCGAVHTEEQEWCLACGSRLYSGVVRGPGLKAAAAVVGLTVLLAGGASAASYAALQDDANRDAGSPGPPAATPLAQAPAPVAPSTTTPAPAAPPAVVPPSTGSGAPETSTPDDLDFGTGAGSAAPSTPTPVPAVPATPATPSTGGSSGGGSSSSGGSSSGGGSSSSGGSSSGSSGSSSSGADTTAVGEAYPTSLLIPDFYDPSGVLTDPEDERSNLRKALDGSTATSTSLKGSQGGFGYLVELGSNRRMSSLRITGKGKSYAVQVYGTTRSTLPGDIGDAGWDLIGGGTSGSSVGSSQKSIALDGPDSSTSYRKVVVWIPEATSARIAELRIIR